MIDFINEKILDVEQADEKFNVSPVTIRRWFRSGLEFAKLGGRIYTSLEAIQRFSKQSDGRVSIRPVMIDRDTRKHLRTCGREELGLGQTPAGRRSSTSRD